MNFVLAIIVFAVLNSAYGIIGLIGIGPAPVMHVVSVERGSRAEALGVAPGTRWVGLNDEPLSTWEALSGALKKAPVPIVSLETPAGDTLSLTLEPELADLHTFGVEWEAGTVVGNLVPLEPASIAGLQVGDRVVSVAGTPVTTWTELSMLIRRRPGEGVVLEIERDDVRRTFTVVPSVQVEQDGLGDGARLSFGAAVVTSVLQTWDVTVKIVRFIEGLVTRAISPKYLAGPVGIFQLAGDAVHRGLAPYLYLIAMLSANLGLINLLPLAVLDGGHLVFFAFEGIARRRPSPKQQGIIQQVGMIVLISLMLMVTFIDLQRILL